MTDRHTLHPFCVVCGAQLPHMTRAEALQKGAAFEHNGLTYYRCIDRHPLDECIRMIEAKPTFSRARKAAAP
ncbi:MAG: hypothetical protein Q8R70_04905 [Methanoregula sp.]|nr:hypothetical protein [Methanoregula sp.]